MLELLDLRPLEERVYLALLDRERSTARTLSIELGDVTSDEVEATLETLATRGLTHTAPESPTHYEVMNPDQAFADTIAARTRETARARQLVDDLSARRRRVRSNFEPLDLVETITGKKDCEERYEVAHQRARLQVRAMERPPYAEANGEPNPIELNQLQNGVTYRVLYERDALDLPGRLDDFLGGIAAGEQVRVAPELPAHLLIVDDSIALLPAHARARVGDGLLVVYPSTLLDTLVELFESTWAQALPLRLTDGGAEVDDPAADDRVILDLLATGLTDQAIARQVGISERTVQRRIRAISERLGVHTRFQAGLKVGLQR